MLFTLSFFLRDGALIWTFLCRLLPGRARVPVARAGHCSWHTLVSYVRATVIDAVGIGIGLAVMRVPLVLPLAALVFLGEPTSAEDQPRRGGDRPARRSDTTVMRHTVAPGWRHPERAADTWPLRGTDPVSVDRYRLVSRLGSGGMADVDEQHRAFVGEVVGVLVAGSDEVGLQVQEDGDFQFAGVHVAVRVGFESLPAVRAVSQSVLVGNRLMDLGGGRVGGLDDVA